MINVINERLNDAFIGFFCSTDMIKGWKEEENNQICSY